MEQMREYGTVVATENNTAKVVFKRSSACGHCTACGLLKDMSEIIIDVPNTLGAEEGDRVEIQFSTQTSFQSAAIAYAFPLIMLIIGGVVGYAISKPLGWNPDVVAAIGCLLFTAVAFLVIKMMEPKFKKAFKSIYKMTNIVKNEEA